jgi:hypothetical protein
MHKEIRDLSLSLSLSSYLSFSQTNIGIIMPYHAVSFKEFKVKFEGYRYCKTCPGGENGFAGR